MWISDNEIRSMYRTAKDKPKQIEIIAQLCCCSKGKVMRICKEDIRNQADVERKQKEELAAQKRKIKEVIKINKIRESQRQFNLNLKKRYLEEWLLEQRLIVRCF